MTQISSEKKIIACNKDHLYEFLSDLRNFEGLMPEQIINWNAEESHCSFTIQGTASLGFRLDNIENKNEIRYVSTEPSPFPFTLIACLSESKENLTETWLKFEASLNPLMQVMATRPLQNFLNLLLGKLSEIKGK